MNPYEAYGSPPVERSPRYRSRDDDYDRRDTYRRRSPVDDRRRPAPRPRSRSPVGIDRYQPDRDRERDRPARDDFYDPARSTARERDDRRRAPSPIAANIDRYVPGQEPTKPSIKVNPLANPLALDTQAGFSFFADWWRCEQQIKEEKERAKNGGRRPDRIKGDREAKEDRERERAKIQEAYDQYKQEFQVKMARQFVQQHKGEEWFKERYFPEVRDPIRKRITDARHNVFDQWEKDVETGVFDEFTLEGIYKSDSDGAGGMVEKEEGEAVGGGEVLGVLDLVPAKGGDLRDESVNQPALLIKTLAPNVGRDRIEEFCKEHLGEEEGGFRALSLSDPNPAKKFHRIGWIMLNPAPEEDGEAMEDVERGDGRDEDGEEGEEKPQVEKRSAAQKALELINGKVITDSVRGDFTCHVGVHNAPSAPRKKALWDLFSAPERVERDYELARRMITKLDMDLNKDETSGALAKIDARVEQMRNQGLLQPAAKPKKPNFEDNDDEIKFDEEGEEGEENEDEQDDEELLVIKKKLDLMVEYLRRVHNFCLFCVFESDSVHELVRKCPGGHLRRPRAGLSSAAKAAARASALGEPFPGKKKENGFEDEPMSPVQEKRPPKYNKNDQQLLRAFNWVKTFEEKILQILEPEYVDLKKIGGKPVEEALDEEMGKFVKQEDEAKYRCKVPECTKLFKAEHFWKKHVEKRHEDWYSALKKDLELVNQYVLDPSHIAPSRSDANSNGHFPLPNNHHLSTGTPRGFSLQNMGMNMVNFGQNAMMGMPGMQAPFNAGFSADGMNGGSHTGGPIRRGGGRYGNRTGPYDRNSRNNQRGYNNVGGLLRGNLPPGLAPAFIAQGGGGGGGKWGDGAGGGMNAMGPREAVQGRSIKSYEDLDAAPNGAAGSGSGAQAAAQAGAGAELDY
ncbi:hypothetical protein LTR99_001961 [Exophiala xenobiotica]|uniref:C2H2-type domain-containing protein n=1 Tax=Vermiconidia calcicola TaxID=1690605 RepID=A0AAV9Q8Y4_9PEZI|nr:hypothetical protein LTR41_002179 [Exophiala xenobiotica]KAK5536729.1 hypothetical protein LTR25_005403 [Vermiconidia calcicola]KAK5540373.1 hypothetical protein LTR23_006258 [Chaetothyriales sp. CCFEE 6169]KAK5306271.1 hypothetical protein LTR99_001961 [Exophiala xenobiotica]KAK5368730.1 hypothetical protein LTS13_007464 [Exophiala xenobiotica]